jgi:hypothetical protein
MILIPLSTNECNSPAGSVPPLSHLTSCTPTKSNLYFDISSQLPWANVPYTDFLHLHVSTLRSIFLSLGHLSKKSTQVRGPLWHFITNLFFYGEQLLAPHPTPPPKLEDHRLWAVRDCLFNIRGYPPFFLQCINYFKFYTSWFGCSISDNSFNIVLLSFFLSVL